MHPVMGFSGATVSGENTSFQILLIMRVTVGEGKRFRHAGFSAGEVGKIQPAELYAGRESSKKTSWATSGCQYLITPSCTREWHTKESCTEAGVNKSAGSPSTILKKSPSNLDDNGIHAELLKVASV